MTWFKVDDAMYSHPKALRAGNAALGLWMRCGSFSANHLTDGFVPRQIAELYGTPSQIRRLVDSGLWEKADDGWLMHDFSEYNPTSVQVRADRRAAADRQRRARERAASQRESRSDGDDGDDPSHAVTNGVLTPSSRRESRAPRPDPTRPSSLEGVPAPTARGPESLEQHTNRLARIYTDQVKLTNFSAIRGVVRTAIRADYSEDQLAAALTRMAADKRPVTADSLRIEIEGRPRSSRPPGPRSSGHFWEN